MEFLEKFIEFPVRILRLKPQINQQIFRTALSLIVRRNLMPEITSQTSGSVSDSDSDSDSECLMSKVSLCGMRRKSNSDSDCDSGTMDPHSYNKIQMTNNTFFESRW